MLTASLASIYSINSILTQVGKDGVCLELSLSSAVRPGNAGFRAGGCIHPGSLSRIDMGRKTVREPDEGSVRLLMQLHGNCVIEIGLAGDCGNLAM
jgi:hypothetical protein